MKQYTLANNVTSSAPFSVSVVIPTRHRDKMVMKAARTALEQSLPPGEVVVVVDGPDDSTVAKLRQIHDTRLRIISLPQCVGGAGARNVGINAAYGEWIAFLDDDDEWFPHKLDKQMRVALASDYEYPIVSSAIIARTPRADFLWPRKAPTFPLSEYLFARNSFMQGEGTLQTSTLLAPKNLLLKVPFREGLRKHQDWDWLLRATSNSGVGVEFIAEPLAIWNLEEKQATVSTTSDWRYSLSWIRENRSFVTPRAYAGFIATQVSSQASREGEWKAFFPLLKELIGDGRPMPIDISLYLAMWLLPQSLRRRFRSCVGGHPVWLRSVRDSLFRGLKRPLAIFAGRSHTSL